MESLVTALQALSKKRILITGHTGFKGSWLAEWLLKYGSDVTGVALRPEVSPAHFDQLGLASRLQHHVIDVRDSESLHSLFATTRPEVVFHLAAQALVRRSYKDPKETFEINVGGAINLLECVRSTSSVEALVFVTSDKCYLNREIDRGYHELDQLGGHDPYSASKACAELAFAAYQSSYFSQRSEFAAASARAGNVVGGGDWSEDRIVPDCMRSLTEKRPIALRRPDATRPWQHVLEPLSGYITLAHRLLVDRTIAGEAWNFGPNESAVHSVHDVVAECISSWGSEVPIELHKSDVHEAGLLQLNCEKARRELGWAPRWNFRRTFQETTEWYKRTFQGERVQQVTLEQITRYEETPHD
jgi:CDP-glucose 4,6-dehydratase